MAGTRTNSNSMTAIFIFALNNKKSGFRKEFFRFFELEDDDSIFYDGTHSSVEYPEMKNKEIDVVGRLNGKITYLMEIKVGINEDLQESQSKNGEYEKTARLHPDVKKLIYVIPDNYIHENDIPINSKIIYWSEVLKIAQEYDNHGLEDYIKTFVDLPIMDSVLLGKGELFMLLNQKSFNAAENLRKTVLELVKKLENENLCFAEPQNDDYGIGGNFYLKNKVSDSESIFIGLNPAVSDAHCFFAVAVIGIECKNFNFQDEEGYKYYSLYEDELFEEFTLAETEEEQQKIFNKMVSNVLRKSNVVNS